MCSVMLVRFCTGCSCAHVYLCLCVQTGGRSCRHGSMPCDIASGRRPYDLCLIAVVEQCTSRRWGSTMCVREGISDCYLTCHWYFDLHSRQTQNLVETGRNKPQPLCKGQPLWTVQVNRYAGIQCNTRYAPMPKALV